MKIRAIRSGREITVADALGRALVKMGKHEEVLPEKAKRKYQRKDMRAADDSQAVVSPEPEVIEAVEPDDEPARYATTSLSADDE